MIKQGLKNYLNNLKYIFTPLGTIALGVVFGLSVAIPIVLGALSDLFDVVIKLSQNTQIQLQDMLNSIWEKITALDWGNPLKALDFLLDRTWLTDTISSYMESISVDVSQLEDYINNCIDEMKSALIVFVFFVILGFIGGYFITKWLIRRENVKKSLGKNCLISLIDSLLSATLVAFCLWLLELWQPSIFISSFISILLFGSIQLFEAYVAHAWKKIDIRKVISIKNISKLFVSNVLIFLLSVALVAIVILITNVIGGLFVGIALIGIAFIVIGINAETYVKSVTSSHGKSVTEMIVTADCVVNENVDKKEEMSDDREEKLDDKDNKSEEK